MLRQALDSLKVKEYDSLKVTHDEVFFISAATGEGTSELLKKLETELLKDKQK